MSAADLFNAVMAEFDIPTDAELARRLGAQHPNLSRIKHGRRTVGHAMRVDVARLTDWPMSKIDGLIGSKR